MSPPTATAIRTLSEAGPLTDVVPLPTDVSITTVVTCPMETAWFQLDFAGGDFVRFRRIADESAPAAWIIDSDLLADYLCGRSSFHVMMQRSELRFPLPMIYFLVGYFGRVEVQRHFQAVLGDGGSVGASPAVVAGRDAAEQAALGDIAQWLQALVAADGSATGVQAYCSIDGIPLLDVAYGADGVGRPLDTHSLASARCAVAKPMLALGIAYFVAAGAIRFDSTVGEVLGRGSEWVQSRTIDELLTHRAGLHHLAAPFLSAVETELRLDAALYSGRAVDDVAGSVVYCDGGAALIVGAIVEKLAGVPYDRFFRERLDVDGVLRQGIEFRPTGASSSRIVVDSYIEWTTPVPYLVEALPSYVAEWNPSWGGYASARGLGRFYEQMLDVLAGRRHVGGVGAAELGAVIEPRWLPTPVGGHGAPEIPGSFTLSRGFCHGFGDHGVPRSSWDDVFGHSGQGAFVGFADRASGLVLVSKYFGQIEESRHFYTRASKLTEQVYEAVRPGGHHQ